MYVSITSDTQFPAYTISGTPLCYLAAGDTLCNECAAKSGDRSYVVTLRTGERVRCEDCGTFLSGNRDDASD